MPDEQRAVARFLAEQAGSEPVETHISAVFVGADTVWKLKKAVRLPFLDFTALRQRNYYLCRELAINRDAAPGLYRDVVAIGRDGAGGLAFGVEPAVEYVLRMAPIPRGDFLPVIAERGGLGPALADGLGDTVAAYHQRAAVAGDVDFAAVMRRITEGNAESALAAGLDAGAVARWRGRVLALIDARAAWFAQRRAGGYVRRCHGDLHLGNLCLWRGVPVAFDALEFDESLAVIDVGYDLAFLLMDLEQRVGRAVANRVMNRYVARSGDAALVGGLRLFISQRAMIRAHVLAAGGGDGRGYLSAALAALAGPERPVVLAIGGLQGSGKSTLARAIAPELGGPPGALVLRSDETRKRLFGIAPEQTLPPAGYSAEANAATNAAQIAAAGVAAGCGHAVVVDATFLDLAVRRALRAAIERCGARFVGVWLQAPLEVLEARVRGRGADASDATVAVLRGAAARDPGAGDWCVIDVNNGAAALASLRRVIPVVQRPLV